MAKDKSLKEKAIKFKNKDYVLIKDRVNYFNENYPNGSIKTELRSQPVDELVVIKAIVIPDVSVMDRIFTGYSQASRLDTTSFVNKTSALENAETSAVGRALAMMGIGVLDSIASVDEMNKANNSKPDEPASDKQLNAICIGLKKLGVPEEHCMDTKLKVGSNEVIVKNLTKSQASYVMGLVFDKISKGEKFKAIVIGLNEDDPFETLPSMTSEEMLERDIF